MFIPFDEADAHKDKLERGLKVLGPEFLAQLCWWCNGATYHRYERCEVCSKDGCNYVLPTGLLVGSNSAPLSVVNQVLVAAEKD